jgi:serine kinase of HPr protein (carbohydrate metabolism regulator)
MEVRGIGIINVAAMFGVKSIRKEKRVDLVITLKSWNEVQDVTAWAWTRSTSGFSASSPAHHHPRAARARSRPVDRSCRVSKPSSSPRAITRQRIE